MAAAVLFIVSAVGSAYPEMGFGDGDPHEFLPHFIVYRIIGGIGWGWLRCCRPMYIAEMAPPAGGAAWFRGTSSPLFSECW